MLQSDLSDPIRSDGNDKYFGMENVSIFYIFIGTGQDSES